MVREKFAVDLGFDHRFTGVRGVYMDVEKNIPPTIDVMNRMGRIFYSGLKDTWFLCRAIGKILLLVKRGTRRRRSSRKHQDSVRMLK